MDRNYYKEYYNIERNHWWFKIREKIIFNRIEILYQKKGRLKILNIGVATGRTSEILLNFGDVTSIEYDKECCIMMNELTGLEVINASITDLPFQNNIFDLVCAFDVIEHVEEDKKAILEMNRVCNTNGIIFITVPAFNFIWSNHDDINQHKRRYTISQIKKLFSQNGLTGQKLEYSYFNFVLFLPIVTIRLFEKLTTNYNLNKKGSDFHTMSNPISNFIFYHIFLIEVYLLKIIRLPFGISIYFLWKKIKN